MTKGGMDSVALNEARGLLRRILRSVEAGLLSADGPAATALVRRLEGSLMTLDHIAIRRGQLLADGESSPVKHD